MKVQATKKPANIDTQELKVVLQDKSQPEEKSKSFFYLVGAKFWKFTEESGKVDTKSFKGLL